MEHICNYYAEFVLSLPMETSTTSMYRAYVSQKRLQWSGVIRA